MTNEQLINILQQYPKDLDVTMIDCSGSKPKLKLCSKIDKRIIVDNGIRQEYILLGYARSFDCIEPIGIEE